MPLSLELAANANTVVEAIEQRRFLATVMGQPSELFSSRE